MLYRILSLSLVLFLGACKTTNQDSGTVIGGVAGAAIGSSMGRGDGKVYGAAIGAILGALIGNKVGKSMDDRDRMLMQQNTQSALEHQKDYQATAWRNPNTGHSGTIVPQNVYKNRYGQDCREFQQTITVGGKTEQAYGRACRDANGQWKIVP